MIPFQVLQIARFCKEAGILNIVASPGSRSAPMLLTFVRMGGFSIHMEMDERSAAYKALGLCLGSNKPVAIFCTSGTAVLNYGPAIAEAFYQNLPLFVFTADRPPESIDQNDGQAVRQNGVFHLHTKFSGTLPTTEIGDEAVVFTRRLLNQAYYSATSLPMGPVHLNVPLREPLYPEQPIDFTKINSSNQWMEPMVSHQKLEREVLSPLIEIWNKTGSRLLVAGQHRPEPELGNAIKALSEYGHCPVVGDFLNNLQDHPGLIKLADSFPEPFWNTQGLLPEIMITIGAGLLSKSTRAFLKKAKPRFHWHVQEKGFPADPNGTITHHIQADPVWFLTKLGEASYFTVKEKQNELKQYFLIWKDAEYKAREISAEFSENVAWGDFSCIEILARSLPVNLALFAGNSMAVRYLQWQSFRIPSEIPVFANRGTSGIDGCLSTSMGLAMAFPDKTILSVIGDMSFIYDRNALWTKSVPSNLRVVVLNNAGGNIFRIIPGSGTMPELDEYFEMNQPFSARNATLECGMDYFDARDPSYLASVWNEFMSNPGPALLECFTDKVENAVVVKQFKQFMKSKW
jgi:2-succinyl-5-enolpyruvyl-6-hydroxy-3-cyclohexene-1-carboxylate synthase